MKAVSLQLTSEPRNICFDPRTETEKRQINMFEAFPVFVGRFFCLKTTGKGLGKRRKDMIVFETIPEIKRYLSQLKIQGNTVGMVPTMGCLHGGHGALIQRSAAENDQTVVSIFLNPTQFTNSSDLTQYPKTWEADLALAEAAGASVLFAPKEREIYPAGFQTYIEVRELAKTIMREIPSRSFYWCCHRCVETASYYATGSSILWTKRLSAILCDKADGCRLES